MNELIIPLGFALGLLTKMYGGFALTLLDSTELQSIFKNFENFMVLFNLFALNEETTSSQFILVINNSEINSALLYLLECLQIIRDSSYGISITISIITIKQLSCQSLQHYLFTVL